MSGLCVNITLQYAVVNSSTPRSFSRPTVSGKCSGRAHGVVTSQRLAGSVSRDAASVCGYSGHARRRHASVWRARNRSIFSSSRGVDRLNGSYDDDDAMRIASEQMSQIFEQPSVWTDQDLIDARTDKDLSPIYYELLRSRIPLPTLMKQFDMKSSAHLALLVALGKARHWEASQSLFSYILDNTTVELPTVFLLHLAEKRLEDKQMLPAFEVLDWLKKTARPPSSECLELFSKMTQRCTESQLASTEYQQLYQWMHDSDAGRVLWHIFFGGRSQGTVYLDNDDSNPKL